ncbi:Signal transduction histidine kinase [Dyadobacter soli]|uniref:Signal transduction histidine kinase n=2 Tax=Dyadobacter soli TaxID=659014 RepID=A0A1G7SGL8_9BACT|nr:Signal transduction histidine kinase [Dyadobacter soli]
MTHFNSDNGLPQNSIMFAEVDKDGFLWLATQAGLVRYDGQRFRVFDNYNSALVSNRYTTLGKGSDGNIYCMDDLYRASFHSHEKGFSEPKRIDGLITTTVGTLIDFNELDMGELIPGTSEVVAKSLMEPLHFAFHPVGEGKGFIAWKYKIGYVSNKKVQWAQIQDFPRPKGLTVGVVGNKLCHVLRNGEVALIDSNGVETRQKVPVSFPAEKSLVNLNSVAFFKQEHQTLLNLDGAIYEVSLVGGKLKCHHLITIKNVSYITCMRYYPEQGLLIVGANTQGLFVFRKQNMRSFGKDAAFGDAFYALAPYGDDQVFSPIGELPGSPVALAGYEGFDRHAVLRDRNRHYWYANGLTLYETDEKLRALRDIPLQEVLTGINEDENGTIWLNQGLTYFGRLKDGKFVRYALKGVTGKNIQSFIPLGNQTFWLVGRGLCMWIDVKHGKQRIYHEFDNIELRTVYRDKKGNLWLGSYGQGYFLFHNGRFTKMPEDPAHHLRMVHGFLEDQRGFIWMSTNNGLFQCALNDLYDYASGKSKQVYHHYYGKETGLKTTEFNGGCSPSALRMASGRFAFPSMNGVVVFHPDSIKTVLPTSKIFIEQVMLDGAPAGRQALLQIAPSFKRLELTVSSPYFGNPNNLNIQYNVEGLDDRWYPLPENNRIVLNTLQYGSYKLRLRKEGGFGTGNYIMAGLPLVVMPFFYQTWLFYLLIVAFVIAAIVVFIKMRYRYLLRQRNRLETEVKDRTRELAYQSKLMEKLTVSIAHDLKSPLYFLSKVTGHLRDNVQRDNFDGIERTSSEIKNTADQLYQFAEEFNLWASSFTQGFSVNKTSFPLGDLLEELRLFFQEMLDANDNRLTFPAHGQYTLHTDRALLKVILRNIIDNANKHSRGCDISISASGQADEYVTLTIADTGNGMSEPVLKRIHDRIAQASTAAGIERNSRLGYQMIIDFANRLDANLNVQSERGAGTSVTLRLQGSVNGPELSQNLAEQVVGAR